LVAIIGAVVGGYLAVPQAPASAAPFGAATPVAETSAPAEAYMHYRRYRHRHYVPRRVYYAPRYRRYYAPRRVYYAPRRSYRRYYAPRRAYYAPRRSYRRGYRSW
jgi:hypothetical protein